MRDVAPIPNQSRFSWQRLAVALSLSLAPLASGVADTNQAQIRIVSYGEGENAYFAASVLPSASDELLMEVGKPVADVLIVVDTSASQSGDLGRESLSAAKQAIASLRPSDRVQVFAADVSATALSEGLVPPDSSQVSQALTALEERLPLGNTNMLTVLETVRGQLVSADRLHTRSIIYIGDAASVEGSANAQRFAALVDALRADHISVHSVAIGPSTNVELMGVLANHTGGVIGVVNADDGNVASAIARRVTEAATLSPIWLERAEFTGATTVAQGDRLPPLRVDRDSIFLGRIDASTEHVALFTEGRTPTSLVTIKAEADLETSQPDFSFLPGLVSIAEKDDGLTLPTAGSHLLRQTAKMMAQRSDELVRASKLALKRGNKKGAKAVADMALEADAENDEAKSIREATGTRLIIQNDG
ncbi:MAG: VWA domain-containing protein, partial [Planctomycetota bacterium]